MYILVSASCIISAVCLSCLCVFLPRVCLCFFHALIFSPTHMSASSPPLSCSPSRWWSLLALALPLCCRPGQMRLYISHSMAVPGVCAHLVCCPWVCVHGWGALPRVLSPPLLQMLAPDAWRWQGRWRRARRATESKNRHELLREEEGLKIDIHKRTNSCDHDQHTAGTSATAGTHL